MDLGTDYCYAGVLLALLATDYCYAGVLLALLRSLTQGVRRELGEISCLLSCLLAGSLLNEGARQSLLLAGDNVCQVC